MAINASSPTIAISGASAGIGLACAQYFAHKGWNVAIAARSEKDLHALAKRWLVDFPDSELHTYAADLSEKLACQAWATGLSQKLAKLDVLVHNLGRFEPGTLLGGAEDQLDDLLATNVLSAHHLTRALLPLMQKANSARIVTIGSVGTTDWPEPLAAYSISKYALEGWHRQISKELLPLGIRTSLIRPGATHTRSWDGVDVDPNTLLKAEQVAKLVGRVVLSAPEEQLEEITIRPQ